MMRFLSPTFANAPMDLEGKKPAPSTPIYSGEAHGSGTPFPGAALSLPNTSSSSVVLGEALLKSRCFHHHTVVLLDLHQPLLPPCWIKKEETSLPTVRVLNAEVLSVRRSVIGDLDHDEYDSINPVHLNASA